MKKRYLDQLYDEGLGASVYTPVNDIIKKKTKKNTEKMLKIVWKIVYTIILLLAAALIFWLTFPLW